MTAERPTVSPDVVAALIESTPERVRRRLDQNPGAAAGWIWQRSETAWSIDSGGETVTLPHEHIASADHVSCTCLLSPRCFHVLACLTGLTVKAAEFLHDDEPPNETVTGDAHEDVIEATNRQRDAARQLVACVTQLLRVGVASSGVVVQSGLLRAVHQCRAEGLHRLSALGLRVIAGTNEIRARARAADPAQLADDVANVLETSEHVLNNLPIATFWIGTARRKNTPVRPGKLHGLFAEPILTRSGFVGAAVYFLGDDGRIYTASDVRTGDAQHVRDAYLGGMEIGPLTQPAKQLARGLYVGTDLTASQDGRLGRGTSVRIAEQGRSSWQDNAIQERFAHPLPDQRNTVHARAALPADARAAGWDFIFLRGTILGAAGPELLFRAETDAPPIRLAIENENEMLFFRENLRMLSHAPGLRLYVIGRMNLLDPRSVVPLAVAQYPEDPQADTEPRLEIPESWGGRVCLGFDEMQRHHVRNMQGSAIVLNVRDAPLQDDPLGALRRRWIATMLSGTASQRQPRSSIVAAEVATLHHGGFPTGAALLDALSHSSAGDGPTGAETFLATATYLRACAHERARYQASLTT